MIESISHITLVVRDLSKTENLLTRVFDAEKIYDSGENYFSLSKEKFFLIGGIWVAAMEGDPPSTRTYDHIAFKISHTDYKKYLHRVMALDLDVREGRSRVEGEGDSIYFHDYDNHLFELHTGTLEERLKRYSESIQDDGQQS